MIPIRDRQGGVVGFGGRVLYEHSSGPKYLNSPETIVFKKSNILFGLDQAAAAIRSTAFVVIVEGYFDAISLHNIGVTNAVAAMGTTLTPAQIEIAARSLSKVVYILMDADSAGQKAARSICSNVLPAVRDESIMVKIAQLPEGFKDSADFALKHTAEEFRTKVLDVASPWTEWYTDLILRDYNATDVNSFSHCVAEITNFLVKLDNPADRTFLIYRFASRIAGDRKGFALQVRKF
jgi:DNA primase